MNWRMTMIRLSRLDLIALEKQDILTGYSRGTGEKVVLRLMTDESTVRVVSGAGDEYKIRREGQDYILEEEWDD